MCVRECFKMRTKLMLTFIMVTIPFGEAIDTSDYKTKREKLILDELLLTLGGNTTLNDKETAANNCLMQHKMIELDRAFNDPKYFNFSRHFFTYKDNIKNSLVYQIIKDMPKGAALHVHDMGLLGPDYLMNLTYMDHLFVCFEMDNFLLKFANNIPNITCGGQWMLMNKARRLSKNRAKFDAEIRKHFTLVVDDPETQYPTITDSWNAFINYFIKVGSLLSYRPVWEQYFYDALKKFRDQNIMYVEVRSILPNLYELDGTEYSPIITAKAYKKTIKRFVKDYPDFIGAKLIFAPSRKISVEELEDYIVLAKQLKAELPDIFAGFDLVGQEDSGNPLIMFVPQLIEAGKDLNYYFHAGETDWYGTSTDENLVDAILLGAKRLGHAYALSKHPLLTQEVLKHDIGIEVNVISNVVLSLVKDIRNHPLSGFFAQGLPVIISSDDPGAWEADPLSEDFYLAFVGVASRLSDLRLLRKLAFNSLKYSALEPQDKIDAIRKFNGKWKDFIDKFDYCG